MWHLNIYNVTYGKNCEGSKILLLFRVMKLVAIVSQLIVDDMRLWARDKGLYYIYCMFSSVLISFLCPTNSWSDAQVNALHTVSTQLRKSQSSQRSVSKPAPPFPRKDISFYYPGEKTKLPYLPRQVLYLSRLFAKKIPLKRQEQKLSMSLLRKCAETRATHGEMSPYNLIQKPFTRPFLSTR